MRQVARRLKDGRLELVEVPDPAPGSGTVSVRLEASVLSAGTERATLEVGRKGLIGKARARPEQARQVLERMRTEGVRSTLELVRSRLEELGPLGYSAAGTVLEAGPGARELAPGDRVAIAGGGFAGHAEVDVVPSLLCARVPEGVEAEEAAFATLGAIAINGFRRGEAEVGSTVAVVGLGLIGQLAMRVARAAGCRVLGVDLKPELLELARRAGAEVMPRSELEEGSRWEGAADAVLVCAATESNDPILLAATLARDRAPVVVVGDVAMELPRAPFYEKELDLRLARSYGPGRYDPSYELHGLDYPIGYVRWTEQRNMVAFLSLVAEGKIRPAELITHRFALGEAESAFEALETEETVVGIVLGYPGEEDARRRCRRSRGGQRPKGRRRRDGRRVGVIGAGSFATGTLIPGLVRAGFEPVAVASAVGAVGGERAAPLRVRDRARSGRGDPLPGRPRPDRDRHPARLARGARRPGARNGAGGLRREALGARLGSARAGQGRSASVRRAAARRLQSPLRAAGRRAAALASAEACGLPRERRSPGPRSLAQRPRSGGRANAWRGMPLHRLHLRSGGKRPGQRDRSWLRVGARAAAGGKRQLQRPDQLRRRRGRHGPLRGGCAERAGQGTLRDQRPRRLRGDRRFQDRGGLGGPRASRRLGGRRQDKGFSSHFELLRDVASGEAEPPAPESFYLSTLATLAAARSLQTGRPEMVTERPPAGER